MSDAIPQILAATTLTRAGDPVVSTAAAIARRLDGRLHLAHAHPPPTLFGEWGAGEVGATPADDVYAAELAEQLARLAIADEEVAGRHLDSSPPHRWIARLSDELAPELVVFGGGEAERVQRFGLGSTARRLLGCVDRPMLVVRQVPTLPPTRVLAAVDLSELSGDALRGGLELASRLWRGAPAPRVEVVFVLHPSEHGSRQFSEDQIDRFAAGELARFVRRNAPGLAGGARHRVLVGSPRQRLAEEMESFHPDLVILGTHGRSGFQRFLVGSVATDVAARAPRCTLVMPPEAARQAVEVAEAAAQRSGDWAYVSDSAVPVHS